MILGVGSNGAFVGQSIGLSGAFNNISMKHLISYPERSETEKSSVPV